MKIPFVTFKPMEAELDIDLRAAFERDSFLVHRRRGR